MSSRASLHTRVKDELAAHTDPAQVHRTCGRLAALHVADRAVTAEHREQIEDLLGRPLSTEELAQVAKAFIDEFCRAVND